jgi:hypothetical protein
MMSSPLYSALTSFLRLLVLQALFVAGFAGLLYQDVATTSAVPPAGSRGSLMEVGPARGDSPPSPLPTRPSEARRSQPPRAALTAAQPLSARGARQATARPRAHAKPSRRPRTTPTGWAALDAALSRLAGSGSHRWVVSKAYGSWGTADWYRNTVYISPSVPARRLYDVAAHEASHLMTAAAYGGDVDAAVKATNAFFGGSGLRGAELAADCMARLLGARWTNYTACHSKAWRSGAARLLKGQRL